MNEHVAKMRKELGGEYHHLVGFLRLLIQAWAHGGRSDDPSNLRLLCFAHNRWLGIKTFGKRFDSRPLPGA